ncbi:MAG TPA: Gfo/Idh/MocA family oxidoreductase [Verrucomicrobiae bacterium]|nr:Gfo/Idh/MocA family oxidoreductase [Verrucomicrobiae bacterium]
MITKQKLTRRSFIQSTVASAAPFLLPARVWAADPPPSERITIGCIGMGIQNRGLTNGFLNKPEAQVIAVCEGDLNRRNAAKKTVEEFYTKRNDAQYRGCTAFHDFRDLLRRDDIDAVVIATPDHWHAYITVAAARAGKDIYCEKPMSHSIREARAMVNAVRANNRVFQTGSMQRSSKEFRTACDLVRHGVIGKIMRVDVAVGGPGKPCDLPAEAEETGLDWNMWLGPAPFRPYNSILSPRGVHNHFPLWRSYREYGGGMVTDWGAHHFDIAQWALGLDDSGPTEILPAAQPNAESGVRYICARDVEVTHQAGNGVWFHGSGGKIYVNRGKFELWIDKTQKASSPADCDAMTREYLAGSSFRLYESNDHQRDWLKCIRTRKRPICDVEIGARTVTVCSLVNLAYYHGQPLKWDPVNEQFTHGTGKAEWLDTPHRDPWKIV